MLTNAGYFMLGTWAGAAVTVIALVLLMGGGE